MGPNLTNIKASPEYLRIWLKDPQSAKSNAQMPNLGLGEAEIEALIAFINAD
jgi:cytochrome c1